MLQLQESNSYSEIKLPSIDIHTTHRLPIKMNPSYRLKHTNPIRVQYLRYLDRRSLDQKLNEPFCLERFAKINNYSYETSYEYELKCRKPQKKTQPKEKKVYQKPTLRYFNPEDSVIRQDEMDFILNPKPNKSVTSNSKVYISE
ncbi:unnamed protein product (macronuclear) [Paramecium tetraurelia]|uniref:Uncharacterized protein n=1 Tax=Paramecium tetraurelia TaxID=5888 RepID=A0DWB9_PARTE|nr:uncharacterized protein GSPATT00020978001 [Paramecium tetraurelia]CAK87336.1 unnamed protein product [Paramecium tetraurelia]|eukprot:XP_001454733.1 hypothetical protein (macronuclear) [Paramecium tetraurelia strain d4-2]